MSALDSERHVALYTILLDGAEIDPLLATRVHEVRVMTYLKLPDLCTLRVSFPKGKEGQDEPIDGHPFEIGSSLEIRLAARDQLTTASLFAGDIVTLEPDFTGGGVELLVRSFDRSHVLMRSRNVRTFQNQTASDIVEKVVTEAGLEVECEPSGEPHEFVQQDNETDWELIWRLADRVGFEFVLEDGEAKFRKPGQGEPIELEWPRVLKSFSPRLTAVQQVGQVTLSAQDPTSSQPIEVTASSPEQIAQIGVARGDVAEAFTGAELHIATEPVKSEAEGTALAQALLDKLANGYIAAVGACDGNPAVRAGAIVRVSGVGKSFSGTYRVAASTHVLAGGGTYETWFRNSASHTLLGSLGGEGDHAPRFGSQIVLGVVTNNGDPEQLGRVRVRYPALGPDAEGIWARVATPSARGEAGLLMLPLQGDEVLIAFEHDDTTRPYVLGSLFNGQAPPGENLLQGEDGSFALKSGAMIYAEASTNIALKSGGDWTAQVEGEASLEATEPFSVSGRSVTISGETDLVLEGSSTLTLKCGRSEIQLSSAGVQINGTMITLG
jgi:phage protein D